MSEQSAAQAGGDAVLQIAIQMEDLGREFYESLATATDQHDVAELCAMLATAEANHRKVLRQFQDDLARKGKTVLLAPEQLAQARRAVKQRVLPDKDAVNRIARGGTFDELLDMAIALEQDAIDFYSDIAKAMPEEKPVKTVLSEEQQHLEALMGVRNRRRGRL